MDNVTVRAPSSTANMGPGFDAFGMAIDAFFDEVTLRRIDAGITMHSKDAIPSDLSRNTAGVTIRHMMERFAIDGGIEVGIRKGVPVGYGMGSSAASAAGAAVALNILCDLKLASVELIECAGVGEAASAGTVHYDNVAASVLGGFVIVRTDPLDVIRVEPPESLSLCLAVPQVNVPEGKTQISRSVLPERVDLHEAVRNLSNAAAMVAGFFNGDVRLIGNAARDYIAEPARRHMIPGFDEVKKRALEAGALGVMISGAGPTIMAFVAGAGDSVAEAMRGGFESAGIECRTVLCKPCGGAARM